MSLNKNKDLKPTRKLPDWMLEAATSIQEAPKPKKQKKIQKQQEKKIYLMSPEELLATARLFSK